MLQRNNRAGRACGNTGIPQELLILIPMAVRALPARPVCCLPYLPAAVAGTSVGPVQSTGIFQKWLPRGLAGSRNKDKAAQLEKGLQGNAEATCACRKSSPCGTALSLLSPDGGRVPPCFCVPHGGKMTMIELTQGKERDKKWIHLCLNGIYLPPYILFTSSSWRHPTGSITAWGTAKRLEEQILSSLREKGTQLRPERWVVSIGAAVPPAPVTTGF